MTRRARAAAAWLSAGLGLVACDLGPLGGTPLHGEPATQKVADWSFVESEYALDIETHAGSLLASARSWFVVQDGTLWLYAMSTAELEPPWLRRLRDVEPGVTVRAAGRLHQGRAELVTDPAALEPLLPLVLRKYHLVETPSARFVSGSERFPATQIRHWFFRFESR
jgi:hypothetical protein